MVCVGGKGSSACNGDSGSPLVCLEGSRWVLRGAASWVTSKQCLTNKYSVYARISSYINWINNKIGGGNGGGGGGEGGGKKSRKWKMGGVGEEVKRRKVGGWIYKGGKKIQW